MKIQHHKLLIFVLAASVLLSGVSVDMVTPVLSMIGGDVGGSESQISWVVSGVALVLAIAIPFYGRISDFVEARKLFTIGVLILTIGSLICALAPNLAVLVSGRMIMGAGMASISVVSIVVISRVYPPGQRGAVLGIIAGSIGIGTALGPIFGGIVGQWLGWQSLFWVTFTIGILLVIGAQISMQKIEPLDAEDRSFDMIGGVSLGLAIGLFLYSVTLAETSGFFSVSTITSLSVSLLAFIVLTIRIAKAQRPFIPPVLLKNGMYVRAVFIIFLAMFAYFPILVFIPLLVVEVHHLAPAEAGLLLLPGGATVAILSPIVGHWSDRIKPKYLLSAGLITMVVSTLFMSLFAGASPLWMAVGVFGAGLAYALINSPANNFAVSTLTKEQVGVGMGLFQSALFLGTGVGSALIGAFLSARREAESALNPLYSFEASHYSDLFLAIACVAVVALFITLSLPKHQPD
ncbi:MFS transporter [Bacillaceae bacterium SIJ1]|uniref:MFS transporter n=1 Tax=Litoribacterium kuwaitense TaxID=1398745 RepID=UPI0013EAF417|nr:MFS transporter [Litoribacterium kuwaitense]NGP45231.1 MFS transporter [Litoribacterium kuwaitense]